MVHHDCHDSKCVPQARRGHSMLRNRLTIHKMTICVSVIFYIQPILNDHWLLLYLAMGFHLMTKIVALGIQQHLQTYRRDCMHLAQSLKILESQLKLDLLQLTMQTSNNGPLSLQSCTSPVRTNKISLESCQRYLNI